MRICVSLLALLIVSWVPVGAQNPAAIWPIVERVEPNGTDPRDQIGSDVALEGDVLVIGAAGVDIGGQQQAGAAYVFRWDGTSWVEEQMLYAEDFFRDSRFGRAIALDGDRLVVGAPWAPPFFSLNPPENQPGAAYIFERDASGTWAQVARLEAETPIPLDFFGTDVAIWGDYVLVGAAGPFNRGGLTGAAYVFERDATGSWQRTARFEAETPELYDGFGAAVAIREGVALVGVPGRGGAAGFGSAYLYTRPTSAAPRGWTLDAVLTPPEGPGDRFGSAVALGEGRAIVGAFATAGGGAVFDYAPKGPGAWTLRSVLSPLDFAPDRWTIWFGNYLALDGDRLVVASRAAPYGSIEEAFEYDESAGQWDYTALLDPPVTNRGHNGIALSGDRVAVGRGSDKVREQHPLDRGSVYVYDAAEAPEPVDVEVTGPPTASPNAFYTFTVAVHNPGTEPVTGDILLSRFGEGGRTLSSGTLAPGETFTGEYRVFIGLARATTYNLDVRVEDETGGIRGRDILTVELTTTASLNAKAGATEVTGIAPNPIRTQGIFTFHLETAAHARLAVYDMLGREVSVLLDASLTEGEHRATWDAAGLPAGLYVWRLTANDHTEAGRVTVAR